MTNLGHRVRGLVKSVLASARDPRLWAVQVSVIAIALAHDLLERSPRLPTDFVDFLPVSFFWIPLLYAALRWGLASSLGTSVVVLGSCLPNWLYMQRPSTLPQEIFLVSVAIAVSLVVGRQTDRRLEARKDAAAYAAYAVRSQEEEKRRLSLELHDDPVQMLTSVCHTLDALKGIPPETQLDLAGARNAVAAVINRLRDISASLRPPTLDDLGVASALQGMLGELAREWSFSGRLGVSGERRRLPPDTELAVFRIAQEALRNSAYHAAASHVTVNLSFSPRELVLEVEDDGVGFDASSFADRRAGHMGLLSMKERAEMLGGNIQISSKPGRGTHVTARVPV